MKDYVYAADERNEMELEHLLTGVAFTRKLCFTLNGIGDGQCILQ